jgi:hypothetical protein
MSMAELASAAPTSGGVRAISVNVLQACIEDSVACSFTFGHTPYLLQDGGVFSVGS